MNIILGTAISVPPYSPGKAWHRFSYIRGLQRLGHEVFLVEELDSDWCVDAKGDRVEYERSLNRKLFGKIVKCFGLDDRACQIVDGGKATSGLSLDSITSVAREADLLLNWSGHIKAGFIVTNAKRRVYLDLDPVYTQLWHAEYGEDLGFEMHDVFVSSGLNIGTPHTPIPDCGLTWHHTLPPIVLDSWAYRIDTSSRRFTTIASLQPFGDLQYCDQWYRSKAVEFERFASLPQHVTQEFELCVKFYGQEIDRLRTLADNGWFLTDASRNSDMASYREYIARSRAEIGIAQHAYVHGQSGWFGDRWSHYLASGKPVLAQSTGFEHCLPVGRGLLTFSSMEEAAEGVETINRDYELHCRAAREFAEEHLDYRRVLPDLLETCMTC